ncbi:Glutamyl-tRNA(Gln) amidotransferase subunit A [Apilactobacillus kunkeei]|uniref:Glutamyl-tRNA(Gln) amidotransferase subunit A n=2 Tax=Apilactobacillus TaxID=2767877 RepID=A0A836YWB8_9LACO|nr:MULTISPECIES: Asp-tRNA(Asn)/Glu-tRNA(Gln) amidotransferase subunit GatA [Apilactobacillus]KDB00977.1 glutamyl-tRNA(Gln) amidotransferase subunit A [Apilactobacillus kunkeei EFB6]MBV0914955.1 Asp-tRNA(Asn)/Glu-tRNA(Gln) amidotransferase subunit GatA [Apilactobacillus waqarii]MBX8455849.1 Asp-tRNA(Asn)/Glu-tRNA(Gln) amidotransferase subunit GatA [Apilactobacillus kunkeei]MCK8618577.1 Asp-tRNA(Asn)/Glu-tRNA(Gln) amidotransferase subunit GatA [Apilactobacillus kunkeei]MCK8628393.1 Asp-tRNA(Asn)
MDYLGKDIFSIHESLVNGDITAEELTRQTIENAKKNDEDINAFVVFDEENAIKQAQEIDKAGIDPDNVLSGIPVAMKDNMLTKGVLTSAGSKMLSNFKPIIDGTAVAKMKEAGTINIGKTNMDEFAMGGSTETSFHGKTKNPWNLDKVPGGSSGGAAAAVAAGDVLVSLGSDTGGSIRQPASFNGIVGMKPTYGRVSRWGLIAFASSLDQIGPLTRTVKDNAVVLNAIAGKDEHDMTSSNKEVPDFTANIDKGVKGMKIALPKEYLGEGVDKDVQDAILAAADKYRELGATVEEVSLPNSKYGVAAYYIIAPSEASSNLQRFDGIRYGYRAEDAKNLEELYVKSRSQGFGDEVKRRIMVGTYSLSAGFFDAYFKKAAEVRTLIIDDFKKVFQDYDVILTPTAPTPAYSLKDEKDPITMYMNDILTIPVNMAGLPGMSVPAGFSDGLPIGMQLIGKPFDESTLYQAAYAFEQNTDFHKQDPKMGGAQ